MIMSIDEKHHDGISGEAVFFIFGSDKSDTYFWSMCSRKLLETGEDHLKTKFVNLRVLTYKIPFWC